VTYPRDKSIADVIKAYGLPKSHRTHWSKARKASVVKAIRDDALSFTEARERYLLSRTEFKAWETEFTDA
jgi:hypothetical protein